MQIIVRSHLPNSLSLALNPNISVNSLKSLISDRLNICHRNFTLHHGGVLLENDCELDDYGLEDCAYLDLNCNLIGGGKKRKKKSYSTPKKIKHKRKKVKLATLRYYKVRFLKIYIGCLG